MGIHHFSTRKNAWVPKSAIGATGLSILFDIEDAYKNPPRQFSIDFFRRYNGRRALCKYYGTVVIGINLPGSFRGRSFWIRRRISACG